MTLSNVFLILLNFRYFTEKFLTETLWGNITQEQLFDKEHKNILKKTFEELQDVDITKSPLIFCHFAKGIGESKYMRIQDWNSLSKLLYDALKGYNELNANMDLVLFEDAMSHICKINRILESPR